VRVALQTTFAASKKEPLVDVMNRVLEAFRVAGLGEPLIQFTFADARTSGFVSSVDRVRKRFPEVDAFITEFSPMPGIPGARRISNGPGGSLTQETLQAIVAGVPRSFPFHHVALHFFADAFGSVAPVAPKTADLLPGILLTDNWWVNGRERAMSACTVVEAETAAIKLPPLPDSLAALLAACGKVKRTVQVPIPGVAEAAKAIPVRMPTGSLVASANPEAAEAVRPIVLDYRTRIQEIAANAHLPHDLPAQPPSAVDVAPGPRKPALDRVFAPLGYSCKGASGNFILRRRTPANLTVELSLDIGTWGHSVVAVFRVLGLGFKAHLMLPVTARAIPHSQYPIAGPDEWVKIVQNLSALVQELDRTFVPDVERAAGPSPDWFHPEE